MKKKKKEVTIYDLAEELNLSPSTVSRALNNHKRIGRKTKEAVKKLAAARGYRLNTIASSLRTNRSKTIGVMVSWINRFFISSLIAGIEEAARASGYHVIITQSYDNPALEIENLQALRDSRISALIVSPTMGTQNYDHFDILSGNGIPVIYMDRVPKRNDIHQVHIKNYRAAFEATEHLIEQGCQRIAHFGGAEHQHVFKERMLGYRAALKKHKLTVDEALIIMESSLSPAEGTRLTKQVLALDQPPDGIFCANDLAAVNAVKYAKNKGIKIPAELAIIGFNDDPICKIIEPQLSSVYHPAEEMGEAAFNKALEILDGKIDLSQVGTTILDTHIVVRNSSVRKQ